MDIVWVELSLIYSYDVQRGAYRYLLAIKIAMIPLEGLYEP